VPDPARPGDTDKRFEHKAIAFLTHEEIEALVGAPDTATWLGRRDRPLLL